MARSTSKFAWKVIGFGVSIGATILTRSLLGSAWKFVTGNAPPHSPEHPDTGTFEAVSLGAGERRRWCGLRVARDPAGRPHVEGGSPASCRRAWRTSRSSGDVRSDADWARGTGRCPGPGSVTGAARPIGSGNRAQAQSRHTSRPLAVLASWLR